MWVRHLSSRSQRYASLHQAQCVLLKQQRIGKASVDHYHDAIVSAANEQQWSVAVTLLKELLAREQPRAQSFSAVVAVCARARRWQDALHWFRTMKKTTPPGIRVYTNVLSAMGKVPGQWVAALEIIDEMRFDRVRPDAVVYNAGITACEKSRRWQPALSLLDTLHRDRLVPTVVSYSACISACEKGGAPWPLALRLFEEMRRGTIAPNVIAYNALLSAMEKGLQWERALEWLARMRENAVAPDVVSYNVCISACAKGSEWSRAIGLLRDMREYGLTPDVVSYSAAISALEKGGGPWSMAVALLREMERRCAKRNAFPYNACISVCEKNREWQHALALLHDMHHVAIAPDIYSFNSAISACEKGGEWQQALLLRDRMGSVAPDAITFNSLISACEKRREWKQAIALFEQMQSPRFGLRPDVVTFSALISACEKGRQWRTALQLLHRAEHNYHIAPSVRCYNACIAACEKAREWESALALLQSMDAPDEVTYLAAVSACERARQWQQCLRLLESLASQNTIRLNAMIFNVVIRAMTYATPQESWHRAYALYGQMKECNIAPVGLTYTNILRLLPRDAQLTGALRVKSECARATEQWGKDGGSFITEPLEAIELLGELDIPPPHFARKVREWVFDRTVGALQRGDIAALQRFAPPHLGIWTQDALTALHIGTFDATDARRKVRDVGHVPCEEMRARDVVAHVKAPGVDRVVFYESGAVDTLLPSVYLDHHRAGHAERRALLAVLGVEGDVELYITHRPCVSCMAAMAAFQSPGVNLKVVFD